MLRRQQVVRDVARARHVAGGELGRRAHVEHHEIGILALEPREQVRLADGRRGAAVARGAGSAAHRTCRRHRSNGAGQQRDADLLRMTFS